MTVTSLSLTYYDGEEDEHHDGDVVVESVDDVVITVTRSGATDAEWRKDVQ